MTVSFEVFGVNEARRFLNKKGRNTKRNVSKAMIKAGMLMQGEVKQSIAGRKAEPTSVDTGRFLNSVEFQASKDNAVIFSDVPYAKFLEFGTGKIRARRHFNNSKDRNKQKIKRVIQNEINKL